MMKPYISKQLIIGDENGKVSIPNMSDKIYVRFRYMMTDGSIVYGDRQKLDGCFRCRLIPGNPIFYNDELGVWTDQPIESRLEKRASKRLKQWLKDRGYNNITP